MVEERFCRTALLLGEEGMAALMAAKVAICGLGGVGGAACEALARSGVGVLRLIDFDIVACSNINRQLPATTETVGQSKVDAVAKRIASIHPHCQVEKRRERITEANVAALLEGMDWVIDAIDDIPAKVAVIRYCKEHGVGIAASMGTGNKLYPEQLQLADLAETTVCPLARHMRQQLRKIGIVSDVPVVYSTEPPIQPQCKLPQGQRTIGSVSFVPPVAGMMLAGYVIRQLTGR